MFPFRYSITVSNAWNAFPLANRLEPPGHCGERAPYRRQVLLEVTEPVASTILPFELANQLELVETRGATRESPASKGLRIEGGAYLNRASIRRIIPGLAP